MSANKNSHPADQNEGGCDLYLHKFKWEFDIIFCPSKVHPQKGELVIFLNYKSNHSQSYINNFKHL